MARRCSTPTWPRPTTHNATLRDGLETTFIVKEPSEPCSSGLDAPVRSGFPKSLRGPRRANERTVRIPFKFADVRAP